MQELIFPLSNRKSLKSLKAGDEVILSGVCYTARDAAHQRIVSSGSLPEEFKNSLIFYAGPAFYPDGRLSAIGPTTAARMDEFAGFFYAHGVAATLGKGFRSEQVAQSCRDYEAVYFIGFGGAAAYLTQFVRSIEPFMFEELGPEAVYRLEIKGMPAVVGIDTDGRTLLDVHHL